MTEIVPEDKSDKRPIKNPLEGDKHSSGSGDKQTPLINSVDMKNWPKDALKPIALSADVEKLLGKIDLRVHGRSEKSKENSTKQDSHKPEYKLDQTVTSGYFRADSIHLGPILGHPSLWKKSSDDTETDSSKVTGPPKEAAPSELPPLKLKFGDNSLPAPGIEIDMKHSSGVTESTDDLLCNKAADSYNCVFYAKTYIEDAPPFSLNPAMEGLPDSSYMKRNGYQLVKDQQFKEGDVIFVSIPHPGHLTPDVHACIITKVDEHHKILTTRQKPDPIHPVQDMNMAQMSVNYFGGMTLDQLRQEHLAGVWRKTS